MDQRAQISAEFVLFAAIVVLVIIAIGVIVADQSELNNVAATVKIGAENGNVQQSLINGSLQPVRVTSVNMTGGDNVSIQVHFSSNVTSIQSQILNSISNELVLHGYNTNNNGSQITFQSSRHSYIITIS